MSARSPARWTSGRRIPGRVSRSRWEQGSQRRRPRQWTAPTVNSCPTSALRSDPPRDHVPPGLGGRDDTGLLERFGLDQRQRLARSAASGERALARAIPVALETDAGRWPARSAPRRSVRRSRARWRSPRRCPSWCRAGREASRDRGPRAVAPRAARGGHARARADEDARRVPHDDGVEVTGGALEEPDPVARPAQVAGRHADEGEPEFREMLLPAEPVGSVGGGGNGLGRLLEQGGETRRGVGDRTWRTGVRGDRSHAVNATVRRAGARSPSGVSSWRFESWSLRRTAETCVSTVFTEMESRARSPCTRSRGR